MTGSEQTAGSRIARVEDEARQARTTPSWTQRGDRPDDYTRTRRRPERQTALNSRNNDNSYSGTGQHRGTR